MRFFLSSGPFAQRFYLFSNNDPVMNPSSLSPKTWNAAWEGWSFTCHSLVARFWLAVLHNKGRTGIANQNQPLPRKANTSGDGTSTPSDNKCALFYCALTDTKLLIFRVELAKKGTRYGNAYMCESYLVYPTRGKTYVRRLVLLSHASVYTKMTPRLLQRCGDLTCLTCESTNQSINHSIR